MFVSEGFSLSVSEFKRSSRKMRKILYIDHCGSKQKVGIEEIHMRCRRCDLLHLGKYIFK